MSVASIASIRQPALPAAPSASSPVKGSAVFGEIVRDLLSREAAASQTASQAVQSLAAGQTDNLHAVTLAVAQADLQFRLILELRNRFTEAYQEIMRMPI
jgi:flagellar hook-basal body complex protein FliE